MAKRISVTKSRGYGKSLLAAAETWWSELSDEEKIEVFLRKIRPSLGTIRPYLTPSPSIHPYEKEKKKIPWPGKTIPGYVPMSPFKPTVTFI